jgi:uncharacterized membrane protein
MSNNSNLSRVESFSDGVFAIALTLLIIDIKEPPIHNLHTIAQVWGSLKNLGPALFAFLLSFGIILISWVNHHSIFLLIDKASPRFIYSNGLLLLTIVFMPFPTAFLADYIFTEYAVPAVVLYSFVNFMQAVAWTIMIRSAVYPVTLTKNDSAKEVLRRTCKISFYATIVYAICTVVAFFYPKVIAMAITLIWIMWLIWGLEFRESRLKKIRVRTAHK